MGIRLLNPALNRRMNANWQRSYLWRIELPNLTAATFPALGGFIDRQAFFDRLNVTVPVSTVIDNAVKSISVPFIQIETDKEAIGNTYWYYGKKHDISTITLEFNEYTDGSVYNYFKAWTMLCTEPQTADRGQNAGNVIAGTSNPPIFYKLDIRVYRLLPEKFEFYVDTYSGFFVNSIADVSSDYDNSGLMSYSITLTGDEILQRQPLLLDAATIKKIDTDIVKSGVVSSRQLSADALSLILSNLGSSALDSLGIPGI